MLGTIIYGLIVAFSVVFYAVVAYLFFSMLHEVFRGDPASRKPVLQGSRDEQKEAARKLADRRAHNRLVAGASPAAPARKFIAPSR